MRTSTLLMCLIAVLAHALVMTTDANTPRIEARARNDPNDADYAPLKTQASSSRLEEARRAADEHRQHLVENQYYYFMNCATKTGSSPDYTPSSPKTAADCDHIELVVGKVEKHMTAKFKRILVYNAEVIEITYDTVNTYDTVKKKDVKAMWQQHTSKYSKKKGEKLIWGGPTRKRGKDMKSLRKEGLSWLQDKVERKKAPRQSDVNFQEKHYKHLKWVLDNSRNSPPRSEDEREGLGKYGIR